MLAHPTLDRLHALKLHGIARAFEEQVALPESYCRLRFSATPLVAEQMGSSAPLYCTSNLGIKLLG